ncbi:MAG: hypothetical protein RL385_3786, partial [Pseudomonadota bacterium]
VDAPGVAWRAKHDALGRRTEVACNGRVRRQYWDTDRLAAEHFDDGRVRVYVYPDAHALVPLLSVDYASLAAAPESGVVHAWFTSHQGAPEEVTGLDGALVWSGRVAPFGALEVTHGAEFHQPLRWPGHYHDGDTGLHYNRFREYDPRLGRYLQSDPQGISGGDNLSTRRASRAATTCTRTRGTTIPCAAWTCAGSRARGMAGMARRRRTGSTARGRRRRRAGWTRRSPQMCSRARLARTRWSGMAGASRTSSWNIARELGWRQMGRALRTDALVRPSCHLTQRHFTLTSMRCEPTRHCESQAHCSGPLTCKEERLAFACPPLTSDSTLAGDSLRSKEG